MKVNTLERRVLAWILVFALFLSNIPFGVLAEEIQPDASQNQEAPVLETQPETTEQTEPADDETQPSVPETEPEAPTVETTVQCTCGAEGDVHSADCVLYVPTFYEKLLAAQTLKELRDLLTANPESAAALTAAELTSLKVYAEQLFAAASTEENQGYYDEIMSVLSQLLGQTPSEEPEASAPADVVEGTVPVVENDRYDESQDSYADATALENFEYTLDETTATVLLTKYIGTATAVIVAPQYMLENVVYATVLDSATVFRGNTKITSVKLYEGVQFSNYTMSYLFYGCTKLVSVDMHGVNTTGVTDMSYMFYKCSKMTTLDMTGIDTSQVTTMYALLYECYALKSFAGYQNWNTSSLQNIFWMFNKVQGMQVVDLSKWDMSQINNSAWCFQNCYAQQILLPDNLKTMSAGFLNHAHSITGSTFTIPAGVQKIGYAHTIYDFATDDFVEFIVAEGNTNYVAIDGILYSADGKEMLAIPRNKTFENNTYAVPEGVEFFGELSFSRNYNIHTLLLPNSYEIVQNIPKHDPRYIIFEDIGNLNAGNSLTIAIYVYTGVTDYAVKDDNPRYESIDGIIYSEDMTTVLAIPTKYNRYMDIPEGVTTFAVEAMWAESETDSFLSECTGISIPSTLTDIAPDQLAKLNRLNKRADFTVEVHPDNPVYALNEEGTIETVGTVVARNENTRAAYTTLADALAAAADDETIALLTNITLGENLTVSADVTINGDGHTITRDDAYTGTMLTISEGATLTLDGGVVIDGGNEWVFHRDEFLAAIEAWRKDSTEWFEISEFRTLEEGAPQATNDMISTAGSLILNHATVQNHVGTGGNISAIYVAGTGALTINEGASIRHNYTYGGAGTLHTAAGSTAVMNAGEIADNYGGNRNGPNIDIFGSFTMNGGKIHHNYGIKTNGIVLFLHDGGTFILRDGEICENAALKGDSGWHCAIYIHNNATMEMHGGKVWHNSNRISAIHLYGSSSKFIFTGGLLIENDIQQSSYSAYSDINPTYGPAVVSGGTCTNDVGAYVVDGFGLAIDRKTVNGKDYVYYTTSDQLIQLKSNGKIYPTFDAAMEDAVDGDTLTVLRDQRVIVDATKSESTVLDKDVTIDFNGKTVYGWGTQNPVFRILADVTITGNGTMDAMTFGTGNAFGIGDSETAGTLTIKDGNHYANTTIASVTNGTLNVEGGYFEATPYVDENGVDYGHRYTLCCEDTAYGNGSAEIHVSGGTYYGFDPQNNLAQGEGTDFVTDNHWSLNNSAQSTWTVHPYITVTFQDARMFVGDSVPAVQYTVDYGTVGQDKVKVVVEPAVIENPALGEYEITGTVKLIDGTDKAENYRMAVIPGTLRVMDIVARIVETGERYGTLADAIADANALETATVELLKDVEFNQLLTVTGDVTVLGNGHTVIRGKQADDTWYTDTLFDVSEGASLTLDGNLTIDGNHAWTYRETDGVIDLKNAVDNYQDFTGYDGLRFVSVKADKPVATADMFTVKGALTLDAVTIQKHYGTISTSGTAGGSSVIEIGSTGTLTMNEGAVLTHNAMPSYGTLVYMVNGSRFDMNGGVMSQNASAHHGVCIHMEGGVTTVNGGKVMHNHTCGGQGIFVRINNGELIVNGGEVYENAAFPSTGNSRNKVGAVIDATSRGKVTINDVHIHDNFGYFAGGINHVSLKGDGAFTITGGKFVNNTAWGAFDEDSRLSDVSFGRPGTTVTGGIYSTEIYQACVLTANKDSIIPSGHQQFVIGTDAEGNPNLWEVAPGWIITFQDEEGNVLQSGPVRAGEIPVFNTPPHEDGYGIFWDKPLVPVTEDATYTLVWKLIVAEVVNGDTHKGYFATLQDAVDAAVTDDTVRILVDIPMTAKVTVTGKKITLDGNNLTITRGKLANGNWYKGTLLSVSAGASLTLDGNLTIDGGNNWTRKEEAYQAALEAERNAANSDDD